MNSLIHSTISTFVASFLVRILYLRNIGFDLNMSGDEPGYYNFGNFFLDTHPDELFLFRAPLAGLILTPFFKLFGSTIAVGRIVNIFVSSIAVAVAHYVIIKKLRLGKNLGLTVTIIFIFYLPSVFYSTRILSENLSCLLVIIIFNVMLSLRQRSDYKNFIFLGFSLGLLSLTRSSFFYLPLFIYFLLYFNKSKTRIMSKVLISYITFFVTISPYAMYNFNLFGKIMFTEPRLGYGLYLCNNDLDNIDIKRGMYHRDDYLLNRSAPKNFFEIYETDKKLKDKTLSNMIKNYKKLVIPITNRIINFWNYKPNPYDPTIKFTDILMSFFWIPICMLYLLSVTLLREKKYFIIDILVLFSSLSIIPFWGTPRFRYPIDFLIITKSLYMLREILINFKTTKLSPLK